VDAMTDRVLLILGDFSLELARVEALVEGSRIQSQLSRVGFEVTEAKGWRTRVEQIVVLPELILGIGALPGFGGLGRLGGDDREVTPHEAHTSAVMVQYFLEDTRLVPEFTGGSTKIAVLDDRHRRVDRSDGGVGD